MKKYRYCPVCGTFLRTGMIEGKGRKYCPNCDFVDYKNPLPVALAIAVKGKKFLLIKRGIAPRKGTWASPSGFIEVGEGPEEACLRELEEETGVSGKIVKLVGVVRREDKEVYGDMLIVKYLVKVYEGKIIPGTEVEDVKFFEIAELPNYYVDLFKDVIGEVQADSPKPLSF
jgi:ADP-ribose pyrophosphatase YjhB (NUDIX family)